MQENINSCIPFHLVKLYYSLAEKVKKMAFNKVITDLLIGQSTLQ